MAVPPSGGGSLLSQILKVFGSGFTTITQLFTSTHRGIDIAAPTGTPVHAGVSGTVIYAENASSNIAKAVQYWTNNSSNTASMGNAVVIQDSNGIRYFYAHLSAFGVHVGDTVSPSTIVGKVGATGNATGPHLHFAVANASSWLNPIDFIDKMYAVVTSGTGGGSSTNVQSWLDLLNSKNYSPTPGQTWGDYLKYTAAGDTKFYNLVTQALSQLGWAQSKIISIADYPALAQALANVSGQSATDSLFAGGGLFAGVLPDILNVAYFIGFIVVGVGVLLFAGLVSKSQPSKASANA